MGKTHDKQSRKRKNAGYINIKNGIRKQPGLGGLFTTHDMIIDSTQWVDFYFLGRGNRFYSATISTYGADLLSEIHNVIPTDVYVGWTKDKLTIAQRHDWVLENFDDLRKNSTNTYREYTKIHYDYECGIGVTAMVVAPSISTRLINDFIMKFVERDYNGEVLSPTPNDIFNPHFACNINAIQLEL